MKEFWVRVTSVLVAILVTIGIITMIGDMKNRGHETIPSPPTGYHYCTNQDATDIAFCRNRR